MDFLANENIPLLSIKLLRDAGHNVTSILESTPGARDQDVLGRANKEKCIILTFDRDYGELIFRYKALPPEGVIYFRFDPYTPDEPAKILLEILETGNVQILGKFTVIERGRIRQRSLQKKR